MAFPQAEQYRIAPLPRLVSACHVNPVPVKPTNIRFHSSGRGLSRTVSPCGELSRRKAVRCEKRPLILSHLISKAGSPRSANSRYRGPILATSQAAGAEKRTPFHAISLHDIRTVTYRSFGTQTFMRNPLSPPADS